MNNNIDVYAEKPRPNLYNVVKKLRENSEGFKHVLLVTKLNDIDSKGGDIENELSNFFKNIADEESQFEEKITGLNLILGNYSVHLLESTDA